MEQLWTRLGVAIALLSLLGCGQEQREEITERYSTGEKKKVFVYRGQGADEELIKRQTYARDGELIRVENVAEEDTLRYAELNPGTVEPEGLKSFLTKGAWVGNQTKSILQFTSDSLYEVDELSNGEIEEAQVSSIDYVSGGERISFLPEGKKERLPGGRIILGEDTDTDTLWVHPTGPQSLLWLGFSPYERADRDVRETVRTHLRKRRQRRGSADQNITLQPRGNQMKYGPDEFTVPAGKSVKVTFENTATSPSMQHNVVLTSDPPSPDLFKRVGQTGAEAGMTEEYVPDDPSVLAATAIAKPGETVSVTFTTPSEPGEYGFVCTYLGHWATGQGTMYVVRE